MSANITAKEINELRQQTGAGMMDCRKALTEAGGDFEKAIDYLRKKGQKVANSRSDREAKEGVVIAITNDANTEGIVVCLSCETDFVAKNEDFINLTKKIATLALQNKITNVEELKKLQLDGNALSDVILEQVAKIGEKIDITKYELVQSEGVISYIHGAYRLGVLVSINQKINDTNIAVSKDVAMQIAAMNPLSLDESSISQETINREKSVIMELMNNDPKMAGKDAKMLDNIAQGKLKAFFKENTLLAQSFVKDPSKSVADYILSADKDLKIKGFKRVQLG